MPTFIIQDQGSKEESALYAERKKNAVPNMLITHTNLHLRQNRHLRDREVERTHVAYAEVIIRKNMYRCWKKELLMLEVLRQAQDKR